MFGPAVIIRLLWCCIFLAHFRRRHLGILAHGASSLECQYHVSPNLPTVFEVKQGMHDAGNVSDDGTTMTCHQHFGQCATLWSFDPDTNDTTVLLKGCWKGNADCDRPDCIARENINHRYLNSSRFCCCSAFNCNANFSYVFSPKRVHSFLPKLFTEPFEQRGEVDENLLFVILACVSASVLLTVLIGLFYCFVYRRRKNAQKLAFNASTDKCDYNLPENRFLLQHDETDFATLDVDALILTDVVCCGRYSVVRRAFLDEREYAVKIYQPHNRNYFYNERNVFRKPLFEHENVVEFLGGVERKMSSEYWIITKFMNAGTLQDYLKANTFDFATMCKLCLSVARGLAHLHGEIRKNGVQKPPIAHRDLNSRNILMRADGACVICDFAFSMSLDSTKLRGDVCEEASLNEVGTVRYMAPEVLEGAVNLRDPETALKQVDVYALGLVFWEIVSRCVDVTDQQICSEYSPPYAKELNSSPPSLELMQLLVCKKKVRPLFPPFMYNKSPNSAPLRDLRNLIEDCWDQDSEARITSLCSHERLNDLFHSVVVDSNGPKYGHAPQRMDANTVLDLNAYNAANHINGNNGSHQLSPNFYLNYADLHHRPMFNENTADTTQTGTTSGLGSMCLNSSDRARSLNSGSSFGYRHTTGSDIPYAAPLQPYQGLNPCLERNLHLESSDSSSGYGNRVLESQFDKTDPCAAENLAKFVPNALYALSKQAGVNEDLDKNERNACASRPTSNVVVEGDVEQHFNDFKEHLLTLLLMKNRDEPRSTQKNQSTKTSNENNPSTINNKLTCVVGVADAVAEESSDNPETSASSSNVSPGGGSSSSSADSAYDRRSLSNSLEAPLKKENNVGDAKKKRFSRMSLHMESASNAHSLAKLKRLSVNVSDVI